MSHPVAIPQSVLKDAQKPCFKAVRRTSKISGPGVIAPKNAMKNIKFAPFLREFARIFDEIRLVNFVV